MGLNTNEAKTSSRSLAGLVQEAVVRLLRMVEQDRERLRPLNILVLGPPGAGKSSFINSVAAALSRDRWHEYAYCGYHGNQEIVTVTIQRFENCCNGDRDLFKDWQLPTLIDVSGLQVDRQDTLHKVLRLLFYGHLQEGSSLQEVYQYCARHTDAEIRHKFKEPHESMKVDRVVFVAAANEDIPLQLLNVVRKAARPSHRSSTKRAIPVFGVLTKMDLVDASSAAFLERRQHFKQGLALNSSRLLSCSTYCDDVDVHCERTQRLDPELDLRIVQFFEQLCDPARRIVRPKELLPPIQCFGKDLVDQQITTTGPRDVKHVSRSKMAGRLADRLTIIIMVVLILQYLMMTMRLPLGTTTFAPHSTQLLPLTVQNFLDPTRSESVAEFECTADGLAPFEIRTITFAKSEVGCQGAPNGNFPEPTLFADGTQLKNVSNFNCLGTINSSDGSLDRQIISRSSNASQQLRFLHADDTPCGAADAEIEVPSGSSGAGEAESLRTGRRKMVTMPEKVGILPPGTKYTAFRRHNGHWIILVTLLVSIYVFLLPLLNLLYLLYLLIRCLRKLKARGSYCSVTCHPEPNSSRENCTEEWLSKDTAIAKENLFSSYTAERTTQTEAEKKTAQPPITCSQWHTVTTFSSAGGRLQHSDSDVILDVPPDAIDHNVYVDIHSVVCANEERVRRLIRFPKDAVLVSPLVEYWAKWDFRFLCSVRISLPHCLPANPDLRSVRVYRVHRNLDGSVSVTRLRSTTVAGPAGSPKTNLQSKDSEAEELGNENGMAWEENATLHFSADGNLYVITNCFSGYVCVYCKKEQCPPVLEVLAEADVKRKGGHTGKYSATVTLHVWDRRLNILDFRKEHGIPMEVQKLCQYTVHNYDTNFWLFTCLDLSGDSTDQWRLCVRENGQTTTPKVQRQALADALSCSTKECDRPSHPLKFFWQLESLQSFQDGCYFECVVDVRISASTDTTETHWPADKANALSVPLQVTKEEETSPLRVGRDLYAPFTCPEKNLVPPLTNRRHGLTHSPEESRGQQDEYVRPTVKLNNSSSSNSLFPMYSCTKTNNASVPNNYPWYQQQKILEGLNQTQLAPGNLAQKEPTSAFPETGSVYALSEPDSVDPVLDNALLTAPGLDNSFFCNRS